MIKVGFKHRNCNILLELEHKITVIMGDSATGKSTMSKMIMFRDMATSIKVSNSKFVVTFLNDTDGLSTYLKNNKFLAGYIYLIDEHRLEIDNDIANAIKNTENSYFVITARTNLSNLNFAISDTKKFVFDNKRGIARLEDFIQTKNNTIYGHVDKHVDLAIIEDSGKAKQWFDELFIKCSIQIIPAGSHVGNGGGKDKIVKHLEDVLNGNDKRVLVILDSCSFGSQCKKFSEALKKYSNRIFLLTGYRCWEYLMLQTNMFVGTEREEYTTQSGFEESFYEQYLERLTDQNRYTVIKHDRIGNLSLCYLQQCCQYTLKSKCALRLGGQDKMKSLLKGTTFDYLIAMSGR